MYRIVIAEDEEIIRRGLVYSVDWAHLGCSIVAEVRNGADGILAIKEHRPDIVIADINMPIKDGLQMIRETILDYDYAPIILSGYSSFEYAQKAIDLGVIGYLSKPLDLDELNEVIEKAKKDIDLNRLIQQNLSSNSEMENIDLFRDSYKFYYENLIVDQMLQYIFDHYNQKIVMKDLVEELNYSETYLNRKFKEIVGSTFNDYLNRYRIQKSIEFLMEDRQMSIQEVSWKCGINDYKYFGAVFKKYVGCSIKEFISRFYSNTKTRQ